MLPDPPASYSHIMPADRQTGKAGRYHKDVATDGQTDRPSSVWVRPFVLHAHSCTGVSSLSLSHQEEEGKNVNCHKVKRDDPPCWNSAAL